MSKPLLVVLKHLCHGMTKYLLLMKRYWQKKKFINNIMKKQMNKTKKKMLKKKYKQPEPRKYEGVFWNGAHGQWWAQKTYPPGHKPRQAYVGCHKVQRKCAELLAQYSECRAPLKRLDRGAQEGNVPRLYAGVFFRKEKKLWVAQATYPPGHKPRQEMVGQSFNSQKAAAQALAKHLNCTLGSLRLRKDGFYRGSLAVKKALKNFRVLQNMWVKKHMIPGEIFHGGVGILELGGSPLYYNCMGNDCTRRVDLHGDAFC
jgi:hypothetical protein